MTFKGNELDSVKEQIDILWEEQSSYLDKKKLDIIRFLRSYSIAHKLVKLDHGDFRIGIVIGDKHYCDHYPLSFHFIGIGFYLGIYFVEIGIGKFEQHEKTR